VLPNADIANGNAVLGLGVFAGGKQYSAGVSVKISARKDRIGRIKN
jgi:hypothetical protein